MVEGVHVTEFSQSDCHRRPNPDLPLYKNQPNLPNYSYSYVLIIFNAFSLHDSLWEGGA